MAQNKITLNLLKLRHFCSTKREAAIVTRLRRQAAPSTNRGRIEYGPGGIAKAHHYLSVRRFVCDRHGRVASRTPAVCPLLARLAPCVAHGPIAPHDFGAEFGPGLAIAERVNMSNGPQFCTRLKARLKDRSDATAIGHLAVKARGRSQQQLQHVVLREQRAV